MKHLILILAVCFSATLFGQGIVITKPVTFPDTTNAKTFVKYIVQYDMYDSLFTVSTTLYRSKQAYQKNFMVNTGIDGVPEIPQRFSFKISPDDMSKNISKLDNICKDGIKAKLIEINPTWTVEDINFIK